MSTPPSPSRLTRLRVSLKRAVEPTDGAPQVIQPGPAFPPPCDAFGNPIGWLGTARSLQEYPPSCPKFSPAPYTPSSPVFSHAPFTPPTHPRSPGDPPAAPHKSGKDTRYRPLIPPTPLVLPNPNEAIAGLTQTIADQNKRIFTLEDQAKRVAASAAELEETKKKLSDALSVSTTLVALLSRVSDHVDACESRCSALHDQLIEATAHRLALVDAYTSNVADFNCFYEKIQDITGLSCSAMCCEGVDERDTLFKFSECSHFIHPRCMAKLAFTVEGKEVYYTCPLCRSKSSGMRTVAMSRAMHHKNYDARDVSEWTGNAIVTIGENNLASEPDTKDILAEVIAQHRNKLSTLCPNAESTIEERTIELSESTLALHMQRIKRSFEHCDTVEDDEEPE